MELETLLRNRLLAKKRMYILLPSNKSTISSKNMMSSKQKHHFALCFIEYQDMLLQLM